MTESNLVREVGKQLLSKRYEEAWNHDTAPYVPQKPEHVAKALIQVLGMAKTGSVWIVENEEPPREITFSTH